MLKKLVLGFGILLISAAAALADPSDEAKRKYPPEFYLIGFAEVQSSGDSYKDRRRVEVLSRLEIAKKIKITTKSNTVDIMCEQQGNVVFDNKSECVNMITEVVEESVDEVLEGSEIAEVGENKAKGTVYAVAVLPKKKAAERADLGSKQSFENAKQHIENAKAAPGEAAKQEEVKKAKAEVVKAMAYTSGKSAIEEVRARADSGFDDLAREIKKMEGVQKSVGAIPY